MKRGLIAAGLVVAFLVGSPGRSRAKRIIHLTLDSAVEIAMNNSYKIQMLELEIDRRIKWLKARKAGLKTQIYMNIKAPDLQHVSEYKWNSSLYRDELVRQNTQLWESELSILQPVMLLGRPTNGYLSLNYRINKYLQKDAGVTDADYYNRLYLKFIQPFLLPNKLKNDLEDAELNLQNVKYDYIHDQVGIIWDVSDDYYDIWELEYKNLIFQKQLAFLDSVRMIADRLESEDDARQSESMQIQLEMANIRESWLTNQSRLRVKIADVKKKLRLLESDSIKVFPKVQIVPIDVDLEEAIRYGYENSPRLKQLGINKRKDEIDLEDQKARNAFHLNLEVTYGLEKKNHRYRTLWSDFDNSNSVTLNAYVPIWDGGERRARIEAEEIGVKQSQLRIEEREEEIRKNVVNAHTNLKEYFARLINLEESLELSRDVTADQVQRYAEHELSVQDILQIIHRNSETDFRFLDVYIGYRTSLLRLIVYTYYDYEKDQPLSESFDVKFKG